MSEIKKQISKYDMLFLSMNVRYVNIYKHYSAQVDKTLKAMGVSIETIYKTAREKFMEPKHFAQFIGTDEKENAERKNLAYIYLTSFESLLDNSFSKIWDDGTKILKHLENMFNLSLAEQAKNPDKNVKLLLENNDTNNEQVKSSK